MLPGENGWLNIVLKTSRADDWQAYTRELKQMNSIFSEWKRITGYCPSCFSLWSSLFLTNRLQQSNFGWWEDGGIHHFPLTIYCSPLWLLNCAFPLLTIFGSDILMDLRYRHLQNDSIGNPEWMFLIFNIKIWRFTIPKNLKYSSKK